MEPYVKTIKPGNLETSKGGYTSQLYEFLNLSGTSEWFVIRCFEERPNGRIRFAHTAPFFIDIPGKPLRPRKAEINFLIQRMEEQIQRNKGILPEGALGEYRTALQIYKNIAKTARD